MNEFYKIIILVKQYSVRINTELRQLKGCVCPNTKFTKFFICITQNYLNVACA